MNSKAKNTRKRKLEELENKLEESSKKLKKSKENLEVAKKGREETEDRANTLNIIDTLKEEEAKLLAEVQKYKDSDPQVIEEMKQQIEVYIICYYTLIKLGKLF